MDIFFHNTLDVNFLNVKIHCLGNVLYTVVNYYYYCNNYLGEVSHHGKGKQKSANQSGPFTRCDNVCGRSLDFYQWRKHMGSMVQKIYHVHHGNFHQWLLLRHRQISTLCRGLTFVRSRWRTVWMDLLIKELGSDWEYERGSVNITPLKLVPTSLTKWSKR